MAYFHRPFCHKLCVLAQWIVTRKLCLFRRTYHKLVCRLSYSLDDISRQAFGRHLLFSSNLLLWKFPVFDNYSFISEDSSYQRTPFPYHQYNHFPKKTCQTLRWPHRENNLFVKSHHNANGNCDQKAPRMLMTCH